LLTSNLSRFPCVFRALCTERDCSQLTTFG
jgi:hypothetical protein